MKHNKKQPIENHRETQSTTDGETKRRTGGAHGGLIAASFRFSPIGPLSQCAK